MDIVKNINWSMVSLDSLLDFIISQSKLLINSSELQSVVISEFSRRFKQEYSGNMEEHLEKSMNIFSQSPKRKNSNPPNPQNSYTKSQNYSFTSDLILKLIKIASKYENPYSGGSSSSLLTKNQNSRNVINGNKSSMGIMNTSPEATYNKNGKEGTPKSEAEQKEESTGKMSSNISKSSVSPFGQNTKKGNYGFSNIMENSQTIKKIAHNNILAHSKNEKISNSTNKIESFSKNYNPYQSSSVKPINKNLTNRSLNREFSSSSNNILKIKSKSINSKGDRNSAQASSVEKGKKLSFDKIMKNIRNDSKVNLKVKYSPIYNMNKNNLNLNLTSGSGTIPYYNVISSGKNKKTPTSSNMIIEDTSPEMTTKKHEVTNNTKIQNSKETTVTNNLTYQKPFEKTQNSKENLSNVKFIKKDSNRPKSATAYRNATNMSLHNLNIFKNK